MDMRLVTHTKLQENGCLEWQRAVNNKGYGFINVKAKIALVHRYAWEQVKGPIKKGLCVLHKCDNPKCCNVDHLFLGTHADNMKDCSLKGRIRIPHHRGVANCNSVLSAEDISLIRTLWASSNTMTSIAPLFNVSVTTISSILKGKTWGHV